jgi:hypothetical protein
VTPARRERRRARLRVAARIGARIGAWFAGGLALAHPNDVDTQRRAIAAKQVLDELARHLDPDVDR